MKIINKIKDIIKSSNENVSSKDYSDKIDIEDDFDINISDDYDIFIADD